MKSADPNLYTVPENFIELSRAVEATVKEIFGPQYIVPLTGSSLKDEFKKHPRDRTSRRKIETAARNLLLRAFRLGRLETYLWRDGNTLRLERNHWRGFEASYRPFVIDPLGVPDAHVFLLQEDQWNQWLQNCGRKNASNQASRPVAGLPRATKSGLSRWATQKWPDGNLPGREDLLKLAREEFMGVTENNIRELRRGLASSENKKGGARLHKRKQGRAEVG